MGERLTKSVRIEESFRALSGLRGQIQAWADRRHRLDALDQYRAHVNVLVSTLLAVLDALAAALDGLDPGRQVGEVYTECRRADNGTALVGRIWEWYRDKLDQRDDPAFGPLLAAADEVAWSCYASIFDNAAAISGRELSRGLVPLPYIEFRAGPSLTPGHITPPDLRPHPGDTITREFLERLPLPLVGLPLTWVQAPWWLLLLGHEVGHQIQFDLVPELGLVPEFRELISAAVGDEHAASRWEQWSQEIFADLCLVCSGGPWGIWSMAEQERADRQIMQAEQMYFPSTLTRLALLAAAAATLGVDGHAGLRGINLDELAVNSAETATSDLALAPEIAVAALGHRLGGLGSFAELFAFDPDDFRPGGTVARWARVLRAPGSFVHQPPARSGRLIACGAVAAWSEVAAIADTAEREDARAMLREALLRELSQNQQEAKEGATRAAEPSAVPDPRDAVAEFRQFMLAEFARLGGEFAQLKGTLGRIETGVGEITKVSESVQDRRGINDPAVFGGSGDRPSWQVFVSHTSELRDYPKDRSYVAAVERAISACGHVVVDMADFPAADQPAAGLCRERVQECQVYIGLLGTRYGSPVRDMPKVSYTELEFDTATEAGLDRLVFLLDTDAADVKIPPSKLMDNKFGARQEAFRRRVRKSGLVTQTFTDPSMLGQLVERSLRALAETHGRRGGRGT